MKFTAFIMTGLILFSCAAKKNAPGKDDKQETKEAVAAPMETIKVKATTGAFAKHSDPIISIDTVEVEGNTLFIHVSYGGGCATHEFEVIGSLAIAKSYPPIRSLQLVHKANGDRCKAIVRSVIEVDLEEVAYQKTDGSEIYYTLEGWDQRIYHKYAGEKQPQKEKVKSEAAGNSPDQTIKVKARTGDFVKESDPIMNINAVEVRGNTMYIDLSYGGGCKTHTFEVIGSTVVAESHPPVRAIQLVHKANGDLCRAIVHQRLEIALENIAYQQREGSEIYYTLEGWDGRIYHKYVSSENN